jgi:hypothetical protein
MKPVWGKISEEFEAVEYTSDEGMGTVVKVTKEVVAKYKSYQTAIGAALELNAAIKRDGKS